MVAQVAEDEPDTAAKMPQPKMLTCMRRPGSQPSHGARPSNISSESRVRKRISPIHTKSGSAASVQDAFEPQNAWKRFTSGGLEVKNCRPIHAATPIAIAIQTPPASSTSSTAKRITEAASALISGGAHRVSLKSLRARRSSSAAS